MADTYDGSSRSSGINTRLDSSDLPRSVFEEVLDLVSVPIFVIRGDRQVLWMNKRGRSLVGAEGGISLIRGQLRGETSAQSGDIAALIGETANLGRDTGSVRPVLAKNLPRRTLAHPLYAVAVGLKGDRGNPQRVAVSALFVGDVDSHSIAGAHLLADLLDLTPSEARIAAGLANGLSIDDLAEDLGIGIGTVRWHVKRAMASTNTRRQGELIRHVLLSPLAMIAI